MTSTRCGWLAPSRARPTTGSISRAERSFAGTRSRRPSRYNRASAARRRRLAGAAPRQRAWLPIAWRPVGEPAELVTDLATDALHFRPFPPGDLPRPWSADRGPTFER